MSQVPELARERRNHDLDRPVLGDSCALWKPVISSPSHRKGQTAFHSAKPVLCHGASSSSLGLWLRLLRGEGLPFPAVAPSSASKDDEWTLSVCHARRPTSLSPAVLHVTLFIPATPRLLFLVSSFEDPLGFSPVNLYENYIKDIFFFKITFWNLIKESNLIIRFFFFSSWDTRIRIPA